MALLLPVMLAALGCNSSNVQASGAGSQLAVGSSSASSQVHSEVMTIDLSEDGYTAPEMAVSGYHDGQAEGNESVGIDLSCVDEGVVAVKVSSKKKCKFQVLMGDETYTYDVDSRGEPGVFPLQCGDGHYLFRVMENVSGTKYAVLYQTETDVSLLDEFQPFIRPSAYANYSEKSACVQKSVELAKGAADVNEVVAAVYGFICKSVKYDREKAANITTGYLPDPDETFETGKGICFDYAALAASMLRSQGIPTKVVFGYVSPDDLYHAWNMFYTPESGWITVGYEVSADDWNRLDLTFSANGADGKFIGNGSNYTDVYFY